VQELLDRASSSLPRGAGGCVRSWDYKGRTALVIWLLAERQPSDAALAAYTAAYPRLRGENAELLVLQIGPPAALGVLDGRLPGVLLADPDGSVHCRLNALTPTLLVADRDGAVYWRSPVAEVPDFAEALFWLAYIGSSRRQTWIGIHFCTSYSKVGCLESHPSEGSHRPLLVYRMPARRAGEVRQFVRTASAIARARHAQSSRYGSWFVSGTKLAAVPSCLGVGPAGVGTSASRSTRLVSTARSPSRTARSSSVRSTRSSI
jgi:hypothetical protein